MNDYASYSTNKKKLLSNVASYSTEDRERVEKAIEVAERYHAGQERGGGDDENAGYVIHCIRVARWLTEQGVADADIIAAAILHDTLEDTSMQREEIEETFSKRVLKLVLSVTRPREAGETEEEKKTTKPAHFKKFLKAEEATRLMKTGDMLDNMRTWGHVQPDHPFFFKFPRWFDEANLYYIPLAQTIREEAADEMKLLLSNAKERYARTRN